MVDTLDPPGKPYQATYFADGTFDSHFDFIPDVFFRGIWEIAGDELCFQEPKTWMGRKFCWPMYIDREKSTDEDPRFLLVGGFGIYKFGVEYIDN